MSVKARNALVGLGLLACIGGISGATMMYTRNQRNLLDQEAPLTDSQIMRGPYMNTGSVDAGRDPDWDIKSRTWRGRPPSVRN